ncbi:glycosyltransferase [Pseudarthrobacter sp. IC2-21]|uniref:glycosyltransferase n=1 Tax=Pseudarthrobacter sp. IC2-21 TaxID=3092262 RepID=UPI002A6A98B9|nr:glycosyltransferase [Pseudarthrobacter sp. IC2-21]
MTAHYTEDQEYIFVLGNVHDKIGGPTRTVLGYIQGLTSNGIRCRLAGVGTTQQIEQAFPNDYGIEVTPIKGSLRSKFFVLRDLFSNNQPAKTVVLVGVWHFPFMVLGLMQYVATFLRTSRPRRMLLVPTMSLTTYDWAKHRALKAILRPLVAVIVKSLDGVVFASSGERNLSGPSAWRKATVILHPSISVNATEAPCQGDRDIQVLFAGRLDPQKDIPLLLRTIACLDDSATLDVVGDGSPEYVLTLKTLAADLGIADQVTWHGWKSHTEMLAYFHRARIVAVTSIIENFCHVAVEALVAECDLILVDRVMSAVDFSQLADISVTKPSEVDLAKEISNRLAAWDSRASSRTASAARIKDQCRPTVAALAIERFGSE